MILHEPIVHAFESQLPDALYTTREVLKAVALEYFMLHKSPLLDKATSKAVKVQLDAVCAVISHLEIALKPSNEESNNG